ncbi:MAG: DUF5060 domain-containing protein, partial [Clostridia bacterium]|nr:DUF5060 domain-containing protein [Clostridia bacterium]
MKSKRLRILLAVVSVVSVISLVVCVNAVMAESITESDNSVPTAKQAATVEDGAMLSNVVTIEQNGDISTIGKEATVADTPSNEDWVAGSWKPVENVADNPTNALPDAVEVNVPQEIVLTSAVEYRTPYTECAINAVFTGPLGEKMTIPGFWDGDQTWKIRFA